MQEANKESTKAYSFLVFMVVVVLKHHSNAMNSTQYSFHCGTLKSLIIKMHIVESITMDSL